MNVYDQVEIDRTLIELDGTDNKAKPRRERHASSFARLRESRRRLPQLAAVEISRRYPRSRAACPDDERHQRRQACRQQRQPSGIHDHARRRAFVQRSAPLVH